MPETAVAVVVRDAFERDMGGVLVILESETVQLLSLTNSEAGYAVWLHVPIPFVGVLKLGGAAAPYGPGGNGVPIHIETAQNLTIRVGISPSNPQDIHLPPASSFRRPFKPAPRVWKANMCGVHVPGLPAVDGGAHDPSLVLSWFYDRYSISDRVRIREAWSARGYTHVLLSWPDSRAAGRIPYQFRDTCQELIDTGFYPCVMLCSKDYDPADVTGILANIAPVLPLLIGLVPMFCVGWELSLWLSPIQVQQLTDILAPRWLKQAGTLGYVHFQQGYFAFEEDGPHATTAQYWVKQVGELTGVLHQRHLEWDQPEYQARIVDCLQRFAGQFNFPTDSGFGHPFDFVALEITASPQFAGVMSEAEGDAWGQVALTTPPVNGVRVMGSGNGQLNPKS